MRSMMWRPALLCGLLSWLPAWAGADPMPVRIVFVNTGQYQAIGRTPEEMDLQLQQLEEALQRLGTAAIVPGQRLRFEVTQVDLGGRPSRIDLHYHLCAADGQVVRVGDTSLTDPRTRPPHEQQQWAQRFAQVLHGVP